MKKRIEQGDEATFFYTDGNVMNGLILHVPSDVGDMWIMKRIDGALFHINPSCSTLQLVQLEKAGAEYDDPWASRIQNAGDSSQW